MTEKKENASFMPIRGGTFKFRCHRAIECFTSCCARLNLVLTPYDILRIKHRLGISSGEFLEQYTETKMEDHTRFPKVFLKMNPGDEGRCPFVTLDGCSIYEDRPGACRIYPMGRAALKVAKDKETREKFFLVHETHCLGFEEERRWTIEEWLANEGLDPYNAMNDRWLEIMTCQKGLGSGKDVTRKIQMFSMASYNIDKFRSFIFESRFFDLFEVASEVKSQCASDDVALLEFAIEWLKFSLFQERTLKVKTGTDAP